MPATTPEQIHRLFEEAFNAGDLDGLMELYEPDAALIAQPGSVAHGGEQARAALQGFLSLKGRITLDTKLVVTVGELAYLSNTWSLTGTGADGNPVALGATTAEVARRQADGSWRYVIDNAWGDQAAVQSTANASRYPARRQPGGRCGLGRPRRPAKGLRLGACHTPATLKRLLDLGRAG